MKDVDLSLTVSIPLGICFEEEDRNEITRNVGKMNPKDVRIQADEIDSSGSRIVTIPLSMQPNADPGSYGIKVLQIGRGNQPGEMAPLYIAERTSADAPGQKWLAPDKLEAAPMLTPAPAPR